MATNDGRPTTIGKYIARFRQEKPRPREERGAAKDDFWWTQPRNSWLRSGSGGEVMSSERRDVDVEMENENAQPKTHASATALDWEVELLSDLSSSHASGSRVDGVASLASSASVPAWSELGSSEPSPMPLRSTSASRGHDSALHSGSATTSQRPEYALEDPLVDDGFVVVDDAAEDDEMKALESSLEDPEIVIQRIRRRLGFQPQQQQQRQYDHTAVYAMQSPQASLLPAYSRLRDEQLEMAELLSSVESSSPATHIERHSVEQLDVTLEDQDNVEQGSPEKTEETPSESVQLNASDHCKEKETQDKDGGLPIEESTPVACEAPGEDENEEAERSVSEQHDGEDSLTGEAQSDVETILKTVVKEELKSDENEPVPAENDVDEHSASSSSTASDAREGARSTSQGRKLSPANDEKPSPRLPPLSPARGPIFRMALTPSASPSISPRMMGASQPPELAAETSKTLDSLLSLVVHSWGEDSFFGGSDASGDAMESPAEAKSAGIDCTPSTEQEEEAKTDSDFPAVASSYESEVKDEEDDSHDLEVTHAADPIVQMLRERINVFEEALVHLQSTEDKDSIKDQAS